MHPKIQLAQQIIQACKAKQIKHIVLSPGSRNAPLTIGFSSDSYFQCFSIVDERCAGFFSLGIAQQINEPVAIVCTSGSAILNYYPAISEAFYSNIPLVVISADRPEHKIDIGDGQTIRQTGVLSHHTIYNANLSDKTEMLLYNEYELNQALNNCIIKNLPVHINAPFEEPLYELSSQSIHFTNQTYKLTSEWDTDKINDFCTQWNCSTKKIVLIGVLKPYSIASKWIELLAKDPSVLILTEHTANIHHPNCLTKIDTFLSAIENNEKYINDFKPQMLISLGGMIISKKIKSFFRNNQPTYHYHIDNYVGYNTYFCLTHHFKIGVSDFFEKLNSNLLSISSNYQNQWLKVRDKIQEYENQYFDNIPYSDMWVYKQIAYHLKEPMLVQVSNSSPIRYLQLFKANTQWEVFCNRGTSGIDGSVSTAIGASLVSKLPTVLITGDLSFFYDSNALWNTYTPKNFRIILVNNHGGGIFRILPADKKNPNFKTFFETPHQLSAQHLCAMYGWDYTFASNKNSVNQQMHWLLKNDNTPKLLEIFTPTEQNDIVWKNYFEQVKHKKI